MLRARRVCVKGSVVADNEVCVYVKYVKIFSRKKSFGCAVSAVLFFYQLSKRKQACGVYDVLNCFINKIGPHLRACEICNSSF